MILAHTFQTLLACPSCRFDPNSPVTSAANLAILVMIAALAGVGGSVIALFVRFARGERESLQENTTS
jgi:hypothetical protein